MNLSSQQINAGQQTDGPETLVFGVARKGGICAGLGRQVRRRGRDRVCASSSAKAVMGWLVSCGLAEVGLFVLSEVVHVEVAVSFEPVFVGLDGQGACEA